MYVQEYHRLPQPYTVRATCLNRRSPPAVVVSETTPTSEQAHRCSMHRTPLDTVRQSTESSESSWSMLVVLVSCGADVPESSQALSNIFILTGAMSTSQRSKRKAPSPACKRCKDQHIRCDSETKGLPCSHCRRAGNADCHIARTKRTRGSNGRFATSELTQPNPTTRISDRAPPFSIDFEALCRNRRGHYLSSEGSSSHDRLYASTRHRQASPPIWGESWYLSYVIQTTNSDQDCLYRPIQDDQGNNAVVGRDHRPASTSGHPLPPAELVNDLLRGYFAIFHPFCPILDREAFLASVSDGSVSKVLLRCVLFIASIHCDLKTIHLLGYSGRIDVEDDLFSSAKAAFDGEQESDRLVMLLCSYLLHYWSGSASQSRDSLWWLAGTIRSAQCMQMHRKAQHRNVQPERERMWRRIWWLLYIRDRQISISLGKPMIIHDSDCDVELLREDDLKGESSETVKYVLAQARLSIAVSNILRTYFAPSRETLSDETIILDSICRVFSTWEESLSPGLHHSSHAQLPLILNLTSR
ncbi:hypothetical protein ASPVEDRAFT_655161 [Aspergillus versicolor CBS 583.65]|uniref:Zn(2)-C6 fungal-type domain-containing protein n=1 Tax=Aspergillus versicolor CBS 583.65 TaxID=1036611 RepID=A0A1L9PKS6_ASPVE|nr:uncharacterized protein ASPVEDRAFT_655161 [Aspergillus versicolor CBS 583.65]OJJ02046.1 hypothetical protein ASPVEDRAFT_655161 [Aspergillus versicolor CBS 583.65]